VLLVLVVLLSVVLLMLVLDARPESQPPMAASSEVDPR
jgi:hypothetical protein